MFQKIQAWCSLIHARPGEKKVVLVNSVGWDNQVNVLCLIRIYTHLCKVYVNSGDMDRLCKYTWRSGFALFRKNQGVLLQTLFMRTVTTQREHFKSGVYTDWPSRQVIRMVLCILIHQSNYSLALAHVRAPCVLDNSLYT